MQENMKEYLTEKEAREKRLEIYTEKNTEKNTRGLTLERKNKHC